ncbi:MAG: hypothetical protein WCJ14_13765 [Verrucomicrobiota bacterium]
MTGDDGGRLGFWPWRLESVHAMVFLTPARSDERSHGCHITIDMNQERMGRGNEAFAIRSPFTVLSRRLRRQIQRLEAHAIIETRRDAQSGTRVMRLTEKGLPAGNVGADPVDHLALACHRSCAGDNPRL